MARYNLADCWAQAVGSCFVDAPVVAHSVAFDVTINGKTRLTIDRVFAENEIRGEINFPKVTVENGNIRLSYLTLGMPSARELPRSIFRTVTQDLPIGPPDDLWDAIRDFNRMKFITLLGRLDGMDGQLNNLVPGRVEASGLDIEDDTDLLGAAVVIGKPFTGPEAAKDAVVACRFEDFRKPATATNKPMKSE